MPLQQRPVSGEELGPVHDDEGTGEEIQIVQGPESV